MTIEEIIKYIVLGIVQGVSEILPISSSGHLVILKNFFGLENSPALEVFLHAASLIAVIFFLRKQIVNLVTGFFKYIKTKSDDYKYQFWYCIYLVLSTSITAVIGLVLDPFMDALMKPIIVAIFLLINGAMLFIVDKIETKKDITEMKWQNAAIIGVAQGLGVFPGVSRSGITISSGIFQKFRKDDMAEYSFILFIPVSVGALILNFDELSTVDSSLRGGYMLGFITALIFTYLSLNLLLKVIRRKRLEYFAYYCFALGVIVLISELFF